MKRSKCVETLDFLLNGCSENHELINNSAARSLIAILGHMINEQEITEDVWNNRTIQRSFTVLMNYLIDTNGKIRKCSQDVIKLILKNQNAAKVTFAWKALCSYLCDLLDEIDEDSNTSVLQCLSFLYGIIEEIPDELVPKLFESLLQVYQPNHFDSIRLVNITIPFWISVVFVPLLVFSRPLVSLKLLSYRNFMMSSCSIQRILRRPSQPFSTFLKD